MSRKILALSEGFEVDGEALGYAAALARRMEGTLVLLMLLSLDLDPDRDGDSLLRRGKELLRRRLEEISVEATSIERHLRTGDPWSELCKFAALNGPFQMAVWACVSGRSEGRPGWVAGHWAGRIQEGLGCPVVTAQRRQGASSKSNHTFGGGAKSR
jgi:hypothetical protein